MTTRERNLATILLVVLVVLGIGAVANAFFLQPFTSLKGEIEKADQQLAQRETEINAETARMARIEKLNPRLAQWQKLSFPEGDPKPEAFKTHLNKLSREYDRYLDKALADSGFKVRSKRVGPDFDSRTAPMIDKKPIGHILTSHIEGDATLESVARLFEELYRKPLLHQVKTFSIASVKTSPNGLLAVKLTLEAMLVNGAEHISKRNDGIFAKFTNKGKEKEPVVLAREKGRYRDMATRNNIFTPERDLSVEDRLGGGQDNLDRELIYAQLTMIAYRDYYGCWVADIVNRGNKGDTALLI